MYKVMLYNEDNCSHLVIELPTKRILTLDSRDAKVILDEVMVLRDWCLSKDTTFRDLAEFEDLFHEGKLSLIKEVESLKEVMDIARTLDLVGGLHVPTYK